MNPKIEKTPDGFTHRTVIHDEPGGSLQACTADLYAEAPRAIETGGKARVAPVLEPSGPQPAAASAPFTRSATRRKKALAFGAKAAEMQFANRKGHGGNPQLAERHFTRQQLEVLLAAAFEAGAELGQ